MNSFLPKQRGFTLIEILVSIAIVAILTTIAISTYSNAQKIARDGKRKSDLNAIATALEIYKSRNGRYPCSGTQGYQNGTSNPTWLTDNVDPTNSLCDGTKPFNTSYINQLPTDPSCTSGSCGNPVLDSNAKNYTYWTTSCGSYPAGQFYFLATKLENANDSQRFAVAAPKWCDGSTMIDLDPNSFVISSYGR